MVWGTWDEDFCVDCCLQILNVIKHLTCTGFKYSCGTLTCAPHLSALGLSVGMHDTKSWVFFSKAKSKHHLSENCLDVLMLYFYVPGFKKKKEWKKKKRKIRNNGVPNTGHDFQAPLQLRAFNDVLCKKWNYWSVNIILYWITVFQYEQTSNLML